MARIVTLGEIMLRLSTNTGTRIARTNQFMAHYGGAEANVAISLSNYGHEVIFASKVPENSLGKGAIDYLRQAGVDTSFVLRGGDRLGTYYLETGIGERAPQVIYDRKYSSLSMLKELEWNLTNLFSGADLFHISGITPALSTDWRILTIQLVKAAKKMGCLISFDINFRQKLWSQSDCKIFLKDLLPYVDICSASKLDAQFLMDIHSYSDNSKEEIGYEDAMHFLYPNIKIFYSTKRTVYSASRHDLVGTIWIKGKYLESKTHHINPVIDRVGGGDAFAGGILHGILTKMPPQDIIDFASAASALAHTLDGDDNQFSENEVSAFVKMESGKIVR